MTAIAYPYKHITAAEVPLWHSAKDGILLNKDVVLSNKDVILSNKDVISINKDEKRMQRTCLGQAKADWQTYK